MARRNGWQLPVNPAQIAAITVFFFLVFGFYGFFAPFLGNEVLYYVAITIYTPMALVVAILYVRCTTINPADPGIISRFEGGINNIPANNDGPGGISCFFLSAIMCTLFVKEDCRKPDDLEQQASGEALFCTLCNAEVHKSSKHCKSCDKCVDGFDHHCRLLNNCVGRKNYFTFIALIASSLLWLAVQVGIGVTVLIICFIDHSSSKNIQEKLGNGLTCARFAVIIGIFNLLSLVACAPMGQLFIFHMILMRKGITTYDYVVAMRDDEGSNIDSLSNSATSGFSVGSSLGLHHRGAWCTPPRTSIDQDEVIQHLDSMMLPSTIDPDVAGSSERANKGKKTIKMSARSLAKLDKNEVVKAAAKARASSSVLRPIDECHGDDSGNASARSSTSVDSHQLDMRGKRPA